MPISGELIRRIESLEPRLREVLLELLSELERASLEGLRGEVGRLEEAVGRLAEAQARTEQRLDRLEAAQHKTEQRLAEFERVTQESFERVWKAIDRLEAAQHKTEQRLAEFERVTQESFERVWKAIDRLDAAIQRLAEAQARTEQRLDRLEAAQQRLVRQIGALGARWGLQSESAFREGIRYFLEEAGWRVEHFLGYDQEGLVFGRPDQVEIDLLVRDDRCIACEIKSSLDRADLAAFVRKVDLYERQSGRKVSERVCISPFIDPRGTFEAARALGIRLIGGPEEL